MAAPTRLAPPVINTVLPCTHALPGPVADSVRLRRQSSTTIPLRATRAQRPPTPSCPTATRPCPHPTPPPATHSARVVAAVRAEIARAGGWISFARYMQLVLYAPGLGYYVAGARKFGAAGDFVTAPEMTPLFAQALAAQVAAILDGDGSARDRRARRGQRRARGRPPRTRWPRATRCRRATRSSTSVPTCASASARRSRARAGARCARRMARRAARGDRRRRRDERSARRDSAASRRRAAARRVVRARRRVERRALAWDDRPLADAALRALAAERVSRRRATTRAKSIPAAEALVEDIGRRMTARRDAHRRLRLSAQPSTTIRSAARAR